MVQIKIYLGNTDFFALRDGESDDYLAVSLVHTGDSFAWEEYATEDEWVREIMAERFDELDECDRERVERELAFIADRFSDIMRGA